MSQYQTAGANARLRRLFALLAAHGVPASEVDDLVAEAGAVAGAQPEVVELDGMAPASRGAVPGLVAARRPVVRGWGTGRMYRGCEVA